MSATALSHSHRFAEQAAAWIAGLEHRKRKPISPATLTTYRYHVQRLLPLVGADTPLANINNGFLKNLANKIEGSPKTIQETLAALKQIIASVVDPENGEQIYPRTWNHMFIDAPTIKKQKQPTVTGEEVTRTIRESRSWQEQLMYTILAGTGLRVSECLAIRVGRVAEDQTAFLEDQGVIEVRATIWHNREYPGKLKTTAAKRDIDLDPRLPSRIAEFIKAQKIAPGEFLFQSEVKGEPANLETITRRLRNREIPGFHAFRRFRLTHLRKACVPETLIRFWMGHSSKDVTDIYDKSAEDLEYRRHWSKAAGLSFDLQALGHPRRWRKRRGRLERMETVLKGNAKPQAYAASDDDLPAGLFAPAAVSQSSNSSA